jgi:hypothetical protein
MIKSLSGAARAALVAGVLAFGAVSANAQQFDAAKFFEKLQAEGAAMPKGFDAKKFFDKLQAEGSSNKLDAKAFFDKLQADGAAMPKDFDAKKFFDKLQAEGSSVMPPMVDMKK